MLYSAVHLYYNFGVARRCGAHYTGGSRGCKALGSKKIQKIQLVDSAGHCPSPDMPSGLSNGDISGFNRPMPEFISIDTKVNPF